MAITHEICCLAAQSHLRIITALTQVLYMFSSFGLLQVESLIKKDLLAKLSNSKKWQQLSTQKDNLGPFCEFFELSDYPKIQTGAATKIVRIFKIELYATKIFIS